MIRDLLHYRPAANTVADVCIVGAGAAGIVLAIELARQGKTVTLLEGGGRFVDEASQRLSQGPTDGLPYRGMLGGRARALGGTTNLWGGQILELDAIDFEPRPWVPGSGWPIAKSELTPFYERALHMEGVASTLQRDDDVWAEVGETTPQLACFEAYMSRWCPEPNFARLYQPTLDNDTHIGVWLHANAVELLMKDDIAVGVRCRTLTGVEATFQAKQYCFCLGTIENSRFFLQPHSGDVPWSRSRLIGHYFQDHIDCDAATIIPKDVTSFHGMFDAVFLRGFKYNPKLKLDAATQKSHGLLNAGATFYTASEDDTQTQLKITARKLLRGRLGEIAVKDVWHLLRHSTTLARQSYRYAVQRRAYHQAGAPIKMRVHCEQEPESQSRITLSDDKDELGLFRPRLCWRVSELELRTIAKFVDLTQKSFAGVAQVQPGSALQGNGESFLRSCTDSFHHMGGMRMHQSAERGVVDTNLKLHGTANTYICSGAVFPTSGFSNPTHTLLALAVRLGERLATQ